METDPVLIREFAPGDLNYIFANWLRDLRDADPGSLPDDLWFPAHRTAIERILSKSEVQVKVACAADQPDEILGFCVAEPGEVLYWCQVRKGPLRGKGLAKRLLTELSCLPGTPAAWSTVHSKIRLHNPCRGRQIRQRLSDPRR